MKIDVELSNGQITLSQNGQKTVLTKKEAIELLDNLSSVIKKAGGRLAGRFWVKYSDESVEGALKSYGGGSGHVSMESAEDEGISGGSAGDTFDILDSDLNVVKTVLIREEA